MATISVGRNGDIRHTAMSARQIASETTQTTNIRLAFGPQVQLNAQDFTIPANMMTGQPAQPSQVLTASGIIVGNLEGERTVNVTRILSLACQGCSNLEQAANWLREHHVIGFDVDIETLQNYNNAQRFNNVRLVTEE
mgnify:CR=1 FL=1